MSEQHETASDACFALLQHLAAADEPLTPRDMAGQLGLTDEALREAIAQLVRARMIEKMADTDAYDLGRGAVSLGLAAIGRLDKHRFAREAAAALRTAIGQTVAIAVWSGAGAVIVAWYEPRHAVTVNVRVGSLLSPVHSATGRAFLAYLPERDVSAILDTAYALGQVPTLARQPLDRTSFEALLADVRNQGFSSVEGDLLSGISALAAPVFDMSGTPTLVLTVLGGSAGFSIDPRGPIATAVIDAARQLGQRLGAPNSSGGAIGA